MDLSEAMERRIQGYKLATAEILYHMPDHPALLQSFLWQELDLTPKFPVLNRFLDYWSGHIEAKLHSVRISVRGVFTPTELKLYSGEFRMQ